MVIFFVVVLQSASHQIFSLQTEKRANAQIKQSSEMYDLTASVLFF